MFNDLIVKPVYMYNYKYFIAGPGGCHRPTIYEMLPVIELSN